MRKLLVAFIVLASFTMFAHAQEITTQTPIHANPVFNPSQPMMTIHASSNQTGNLFEFYNPSGQLVCYVDTSGTLHCPGGSGTGTVTSLSAGALSPLFTTTVATPTTTPALTFTQSTSAAETLFGNSTGSAALPSFQPLSSWNIPVYAGAVTAGDCVKWNAAYVLADAGAACGSGAGGISAVNGTADQISASTSSGVVTLSLPSTLTLPGTLSATSVTAGGSTAGCLALNELPTNGTNYIQVCSPATVAASTSWTWPAADGVIGQVLSTNGSGVLSWATGGSANAIVNNPSTTQTITPTSASVTGLVVDSTLSPTADLFDVENNGTVVLSEVGVGSGTSTDGILKTNNIESISTTLALQVGNDSNNVILSNSVDAMLTMTPDNGGEGTVGILGTAAAGYVGNDAAIGVKLIAASAIAAGQLVCIDSAEADAVIPCASGAGSTFLGFVPLGQATAGALAAVALSGKVAAAISDGSAACVVGEYVIASGTIGGDVACQPTLPAQGLMVGFALSAAPATAARTFNLVIDKR